jgi:hypothetical protein
MEPSVWTRITEMRSQLAKISKMLDELELCVVETKDIVTSAQIATQIKIAEDNLWPKDFASKLYLKAAQSGALEASGLSTGNSGGSVVGSQLRASAKPFTLSELALRETDLAVANAVCSKTKI